MTRATNTVFPCLVAALSIVGNACKQPRRETVDARVPVVDSDVPERIADRSGQPTTTMTMTGGDAAPVSQDGAGVDVLPADVAVAAGACGNGRIDPGELCDPPGSCPRTCPVPPDSCRRFKLDRQGTCQARCVPAGDETSCRSGDSCCPAGCTLAADGDCTPPNKMFVTSMEYSGELGGLAGADAKCAARAQAAGLSGTFVAFLSTSTRSAWTRLQDASGWVRTDGKPFGQTWTDLKDGRTFYPPVLDESGRPVPQQARAFSGAGPDLQPTPLADVCHDWQAPAAGGSSSASAGLPETTGGSWYAAVYGLPCQSMSRLYCFEVGRKALVGSRSPPPGVRLAFVSRPLGSSVGLVGADAACNEDAAVAGFTGAFRALLATRAATAISRLNVGGAPWYRVDGVQVVSAAAELATGRLLAPIGVHADGRHAEGAAVRTGAFAPSSEAVENCGDWAATDSLSMSFVGSSERTGNDWFNHRRLPCSVQAPVYCLQQ